MSQSATSSKLATAHKITIECKSGLFEFECEAGQSLLYGGLGSGLTLPYECATGTCGTCRGRVMEGDVEVAWGAAPGMSRLKPEKGDVLMCQTRARSDCVIRVPSNIGREEPSPWHPGSQSGTLKRLRRLTRDVTEFEVALAQPIRFQAGQFMTLEAPGIAGSRAYSMVNYQEETDRLVFVVKKLPGGGFSEWLFDHAREGAGLQLFGPLGQATYRPTEDEDSDLLCVTGGSGIAGIMSILNAATASAGWSRSGELFFGVRTMADIFYAAELADLVGRSDGRLKVTVALSDEAPPASRHPDHPELGLAEGMVHEVAAGQLSERATPTIGFVAGPPPMVDAALRVLIATAGLSPQNIRYDKFS